MSERLRRAQRLVNVQSVLDRLAEWKLIDCECKDALLQERRNGLIRFIDSEAAFTGLFAGVMMRRLDELAQQHANLSAEMKAQAERRLSERARLRTAERIADMLAREAQQFEDLRQLTEMIEAAVEYERIRQRQA